MIIQILFQSHKEFLAQLLVIHGRQGGGRAGKNRGQGVARRGTPETRERCQPRRTTNSTHSLGVWVLQAWALGLVLPCGFHLGLPHHVFRNRMPRGWLAGLARLSHCCMTGVMPYPRQGNPVGCASWCRENLANRIPSMPALPALIAGLCRLARIVLVMALAGLAGCGQYGPLELPPDGSLSRVRDE